MSALAKIHVAKKQLGLDDAAYRELLMAETGKSSSGQMTEAERARVLAAMQRLGFRPAAAPRTKRPAHVRLVYALWGELQQRGQVKRGPAGARALRAFVERQTGCAAPEFLTVEAAPSVIEALKSRIARARSDAVLGRSVGARRP